MIFVTVGTQLPFDRLLDMVSGAIEELAEPVQCQAQADSTEKSWSNIEKIGSVDTVAFASLLEEAKVVVGHANMGTIIQCLSLGKPLIIVPRLSKHGEYRNDHRVDTTEKFVSDRVLIANNQSELLSCITKLMNSDLSAETVSLEQSTELSRFIAQYVNSLWHLDVSLRFSLEKICYSSRSVG